jgi:hypothetical protein
MPAAPWSIVHIPCGLGALTPDAPGFARVCLGIATSGLGPQELVSLLATAGVLGNALCFDSLCAVVVQVG